MPVQNKAFLSLDKRFQPIVLEILTQLEAKGYKPFVVEGKRTIEQQREKVRLQYSRTMHSVHLSGLAADIADERELWEKGAVRPFWWDYYQIAKSLDPTSLSGIKCHLRYGIIWDHPEREVIYKKALDDLLSGKITQKQANERILWFIDVAHIELHLP